VEGLGGWLLDSSSELAHLVKQLCLPLRIESLSGKLGIEVNSDLYRNFWTALTWIITRKEIIHLKLNSKNEIVQCNLRPEMFRLKMEVPRHSLSVCTV